MVCLRQVYFLMKLNTNDDTIIIRYFLTDAESHMKEKDKAHAV